MNVLTGDNGLGKSFVLDVGWWTLTGTWPERAAWPRETSTREGPAKIRAVVEGKTTESLVDAHYDHPTSNWIVGGGRLAMPGLVLYFRVDGRFSLWDPAQHYWRRSKLKQVDDPNRPDALPPPNRQTSTNSVENPAGNGSKTIPMPNDRIPIDGHSSRIYEARFMGDALILASTLPRARVIIFNRSKAWEDTRRRMNGAIIAIAITP